eukprot:751900-Hanusia_phi.AAC.1
MGKKSRSLVHASYLVLLFFIVSRQTTTEHVVGENEIGASLFRKECDYFNSTCLIDNLKIDAKWNEALASYSYVSKSIWLEYDLILPEGCVDFRIILVVCFSSRVTMSCMSESDTCLLSFRTTTTTEQQIVSHVYFDDMLVFNATGIQVGVLLEDVELGRHWMKIVVSHVDNVKVSRSCEEFFFALSLTVIKGEKDLYMGVCLYMIEGYMSEEEERKDILARARGGCNMRPREVRMRCIVVVVNIDGQKQAHLPSVSNSFLHPTCVDVPSETVQGVGRHSVVAELVDESSFPLGPISYTHLLGVICKQDVISFLELNGTSRDEDAQCVEGYQWMVNVINEVSEFQTEWDSVIDLQ